MNLYTQLQAVRSEEDVKDAYIRALGLKGYSKGLIDIQTKEIWFEAKDSGKYSSYAMFTQLLRHEMGKVWRPNDQKGAGRDVGPHWHPLRLGQRRHGAGQFLAA